MANQFLSLALFLMLLSFFIVMNSMSDYEESKSRPVINSIALAFSNEPAKEVKAPSLDVTNIMAVGDGDSLEELEGLFNAHMAGFQVSRNRLGTVMHVKTPIEQFGNAIDIVGSDYSNMEVGKKGSFLMTMITLLRSKKKGASYRVDMVVNIPKDPAIFQKQNPDEFKKKLRQVSSFAKTLESAGLPKKMISAGLAKGKDGFIDLYFYRYKPIKMPSNINGDTL